MLHDKWVFKRKFPSLVCREGKLGVEPRLQNFEQRKKQSAATIDAPHRA